MEIRNPKYNQRGTIDCEINHPEYGWIPFTASPDDVEAHGREIYDRVFRGDIGEIQPCEPPEPVEVAPSVEDLIHQKMREMAMAELEKEGRIKDGGLVEDERREGQ